MPEHTMTAVEPLPPAVAGDSLSGADLQAAIDQLLATADDLNAAVEAATSVDEVQQIGRTQQKLRSQAGDLTVAQINLLVGQAKITASQIDDAIDYCTKVIKTIADWRQRVVKIGAVVEFIGVVLTGRGADILKAAVKLKAAIDA
jgi:hypothetical protein